MFKFLHAADIHLDSPLRGLDQYEGAPVDAIRGATRKAFSNLVRLAIHERVDFVILAGDVYDGEWRDYNTGLYFIKELRELDRAGIPVVMIRGNHDAESRITSQLTLPPNTREFSTSGAETWKLDALGVAIHGQGYARQAETRNLAADYPVPVGGYYNIGVLHTALDGREGHEPYAPTTISELEVSGYHYWALGHVHQRNSENGDRHPRIEFPGNIQGRHIRECGPKGCLLVSVDAQQRAIVDFQAIDVFRWAEVKVDAKTAGSTADALLAAQTAIAEQRDQAEGRPLAVRIVVTCGDGAQRQVVADVEQFRADLAGRVDPDIWVEKIRFERVGATTDPLESLTGDADSELRAALSELRNDSVSTSELFNEGDCGKLKKALPPELRTTLEKRREDIFSLARSFLESAAEDNE